MPLASPSAPERILFVRLSHLGDLVHALPVWHATRRAFPSARLAFATQPTYAPLLTGMAGLERIIPFDREGGLAAWWRFRRAARAFRPTWTIDCQGNWKGAMATWLSGAPRRSGLARGDWREPSASRLLNDLAPDREPGRDHAVDRQLALARHVSGEDAEPDFDFSLSEDELARGRELLRGHSPGGRPLLLHLGRPGDPRSWSAEGFFQLARLAADGGRRVLMLGGPDERALAAAAQAAACHPSIGLELGTLALRPLAALFAAARDQGGQLVACDSGPAHIAAAVGLAVHLLAGPQDPSRTGPWPPPGRTDRPSPHATQTAAVSLACRPCLSRTCHNASGAECLEALRAEEVLAALA